MGAGETFVLIILIICLTVLFTVYMYCCYQNEIGLFANPRYDERIKNLEKEIKLLKENN